MHLEVLPRSRTWNKKGGGWWGDTTASRDILRKWWSRVKTGMKITRWATSKGGCSDRGTDGGRMRVTAAHGVGSQKIKFPQVHSSHWRWGKLFCSGENQLWILKGELQPYLLCQAKPCVCYVPRVMFSLHLQAVLSWNSGFASPVTFQTFCWHPESCCKVSVCWAGLATKHLSLGSSPVPSVSVKAGLCTTQHYSVNVCVGESEQGVHRIG